MWFEQNFIEYAHTGAWIESPYFDDEVVGVAARSTPQLLASGNRAKGIQYALLEGSLDEALLNQLTSPAPSAYFAALVAADIAPALWRPAATKQLENMGIVGRKELEHVLGRLAADSGPYYTLSSYLWRISASEAWLAARS
jgi:hypothetical protein